MKMYLVNVRGVKSKMNSIKGILEEHQPDIVGMVETHVNQVEHLEMEGYTLIRNDRNEEGGGVMLMMKSEYKQETIEVERTSGSMESLWVTMGTKTIYRIGVIYIPKGDKETKKNLESIYKNIKEQIKRAEELSQRIIIMGDFNCKVGESIEGNKEEISKGGKMLLKVIKDYKLAMVNNHEECIGKWTRKENNSYAILDYIIINEEHMEKIKKVVIDEEKESTPYRVVKEGGKVKTIYTDHCAMICEMEGREYGKWKQRINKIWEEENTNKGMKVMTKKGYEKFRQLIERKQVSRIWKEEKQLQETFDRWNEVIGNIKEKCKVKKRESREDQSKTLRKLHTLKRELKRQERIENNREKKIQIRKRRNMVKKWIWNEEKDKYQKKLEKTIEDLRKENGGMKEETFWQIKKRVEKKKEEKPTAIMDEEGKPIEDKKCILEEN